MPGLGQGAGPRTPVMNVKTRNADLGERPPSYYRPGSVSTRSVTRESSGRFRLTLRRQTTRWSRMRSAASGLAAIPWHGWSSWGFPVQGWSHHGGRMRPSVGFQVVGVSLWQL